MATKYYAEIGEDNRVLQQLSVEDPDEGPPRPVATQFTARLLTSPIDWGTQPSLTAELIWPDSESSPGWVENGVLQVMVAAAVAKCYPDIDAVYAAAIGNRAVEYTDAETDARAFAAGAQATENVTSFAKSNPTGQEQSNEWSAAQIIGRADAFKAAQMAMRSRRFDTQAAMRACTTPAELAHVVYLWDQFINQLRAQLGI